MLRAKAFGDRKYSHQVGANQDDDGKSKVPQSTMPNPPSFYDQDVESFLNRKGTSRNLREFLNNNIFDLCNNLLLKDKNYSDKCVMDDQAVPPLGALLSA